MTLDQIKALSTLYTQISCVEALLFKADVTSVYLEEVLPKKLSNKISKMYKRIDELLTELESIEDAAGIKEDEE